MLSHFIHWRRLEIETSDSRVASSGARRESGPSHRRVSNKLPLSETWPQKVFVLYP